MIFILALLFIAVNSIYWICIFSAFSFYRTERGKNHSDEERLKRSAIMIPVGSKNDISVNCFSSLAGQLPQAHELIIVDDHAGIESIFQGFITEFPNIKLMKNEYSQGKKQALSYGIGRTARDFIVLTDADCNAASSRWLSLMLSPFRDEKIDIVVGYSPYTGNNLLSLFIRFETFMAALQYFSYALRGIPYMGVGRNMAIRKRLFIEKRGFESHIDILSGSDDLFVSEAANSRNIAVQVNPDSFVYTFPPADLMSFIRQKIRHISTSFRYKWKHKVLLSIYAFSHIALYASLIALLLTGQLKTGLSLIFMRYILILFFSYGSFSKLGEKKLLYWFPVLDFLMFIYYLVMPFFYLIYDKKRWK